MPVQWSTLRTVVVIDTESYVDMLTGQRRLLAIAMALLNITTGETSETRYCVVKPRGGYHPDARSCRVHGLTAERVVATGTDVHDVLTCLHDLTHGADALVAHDIAADLSVLVTESVIVGHKCLLQRVSAMPQVCTKIESTAICGIPLLGPTVCSGWKWPSLVDVAKTLIGEDMRRDSHHSCPDDTRVCAQVMLRLYHIHTQ